VPPQADLAGFADAQSRLRNQFAEEVTFMYPEQFAWPAGTPIDPETDEPYDPTVEPITASAASAVVGGGGAGEKGPPPPPRPARRRRTPRPACSSRPTSC
jgi:hypothetical protein